MAIENLDVNETLEKARRLLKEDETGFTCHSCYHGSAYSVGHSDGESSWEE